MDFGRGIKLQARCLTELGDERCQPRAKIWHLLPKLALILRMHVDAIPIGGDANGACFASRMRSVVQSAQQQYGDVARAWLAAE